jgi:hypothetical protein
MGKNLYKFNTMKLGLKKRIERVGRERKKFEFYKGRHRKLQ